MTTANKEWQEAKLEKSDTSQPLLQIRYTGDSTATIAYDNDGGGSTDALLVTVVIGSTTTTFDVDGADETAATLDALVTGLNALADVDAVRYNGPGDLSLNTNDFIDATATSIGRTWENSLYQDASEVLTSTLRLSVPMTGDKGSIEIGLIQGSSTYASGAATVSVSSDPGPASTDEAVVYSKVAAATTVESDIFNNIAAPLKFKGPALIEVTGSAALAACDYRVLYRSGI